MKEHIKSNLEKEVFIIGSGPGDIMHLTPKAREAIINSQEVYAFDRFFDLFTSIRQDIKKCSCDEIVNKVENSFAKTICILVSGDIGFFSIAKTLINKIGCKYNVYSLCGISSLQYFCGKLGISYEDINIVSLHGRQINILGDIAYNRYTFVLTGGKNNASTILQQLHENGVTGITVTAGENLSMPTEKIVSGNIKELLQYNFDSLTVLLFENMNYKDKEKTLFDKDFSRNKTPMTKQEVRWTCTSMLDISPTDIVFDIGAGSGSVAIAMSRKAYKGTVYAIEQNPNAYTVLNENIFNFCALNVISVLGEATNEIKKLPIPSKVFIGGSGGNLREIVEFLYKQNPNVTVVLNAITLETLSLSMSVFEDLAIKPSVLCLNTARNKTVGNYNMMTANNPVYIICSTSS